MGNIWSTTVVKERPLSKARDDGVTDQDQVCGVGLFASTQMV